MRKLGNLFKGLFTRQQPVKRTVAAVDIRAREAAIYGDESIELQRLYEKWISRETWLLKSEAIPLLLRRDPAQPGGDEEYQSRYADLLQHATVCVQKGLLKLENSRTTEIDRWEVSPARVYQWASVSRITLPEQLTRLMEFVLMAIKRQDLSSEESYAGSGAGRLTEAVNPTLSSDKEQTLGAALAVLAGHYQECVGKSGQVKADRIINIVMDKADMLFENASPDISSIAMQDLVNSWLNKITRE